MQAGGAVDVVDDVVVVVVMLGDVGQAASAVGLTIFHVPASSRVSVPPAAPPNETQ
jgi:hypothetical protein